MSSLCHRLWIFIKIRYCGVCGLYYSKLNDLDGWNDKSNCECSFALSSSGKNYTSDKILDLHFSLAICFDFWRTDHWSRCGYERIGIRQPIRPPDHQPNIWSIRIFVSRELKDLCGILRRDCRKETADGRADGLLMNRVHIHKIQYSQKNHCNYKVNRCLARYSPRATTTSQPTNRAPNEHWPNMPVLGPKSNFLGAGSKTFGTLISGFRWNTFFVLKTLIGEAPIDH